MQHTKEERTRLPDNMSRLKDIAHFASVNPSSAHYHLSNLIRSGVVKKSSYGRCALRESTSRSCEQDLKPFEKWSHQFTKIRTFENLHE